MYCYSSHANSDLHEFHGTLEAGQRERSLKNVHNVNCNPGFSYFDPLMRGCLTYKASLLVSGDLRWSWSGLYPEFPICSKTLICVYVFLDTREEKGASWSEAILRRTSRPFWWVRWILFLLALCHMFVKERIMELLNLGTTITLAYTKRFKCGIQWMIDFINCEHWPIVSICFFLPGWSGWGENRSSSSASGARSSSANKFVSTFYLMLVTLSQAFCMFMFCDWIGVWIFWSHDVNQWYQ